MLCRLAHLAPGIAALVGEDIAIVVTVKGANVALGRNWPLAMREIGAGLTVGPAGPWVNDAHGTVHFYRHCLEQGATSVWVTPEHGDPEGTAMNISFATPEAILTTDKTSLTLHEVSTTTVLVKGPNGALGRNWPVTVAIESGATVTPAGPWVTDDNAELTLPVTATVAGPYTLQVTPEHGGPASQDILFADSVNNFALVVVAYDSAIDVGGFGTIDVRLLNAWTPSSR